MNRSKILFCFFIAQLGPRPPHFKASRSHKHTR